MPGVIYQKMSPSPRRTSAVSKGENEEKVENVNRKWKNKERSRKNLTKINAKG
jgi:hypothetical protein